MEPSSTTARFLRLGQVIQSDRDQLTEKWLEQARKQMPQADSARRDVMKDELPEYLEILGCQLADTGTRDVDHRSERVCRNHGKQRWRVGWSLTEVVNDYQIMRSVILRHLNDVLDVPLSIDETVAVNTTLDDAIGGSVQAYVEESENRFRALNDALESKVQERTGQLRGLAQALIEAEQRERRRIARLLHEHLQQFLFAARMRLQKLRGAIDPSHQQILADADELILQAIKDARSLTTSLSPPILHDGGLEPALMLLAEEMLELHNLRVDVEIGPDSDCGTAAVREFLYQAARELLQNVVKHSGQNRARLELHSRTEQEIQLTVRDKGTGMPAADAQRPEAGSQGFGLADIRQRVEVLGGELRIQPTSPAGTTVTLKVPGSD